VLGSLTYCSLRLQQPGLRWTPARAMSLKVDMIWGIHPPVGPRAGLCCGKHQLGGACGLAPRLRATRGIYSGLMNILAPVAAAIVVLLASFLFWYYLRRRQRRALLEVTHQLHRIA